MPARKETKGSLNERMGWKSFELPGQIGTLAAEVSKIFRLGLNIQLNFSTFLRFLSYFHFNIVLYNKDSLEKGTIMPEFRNSNLPSKSIYFWISDNSLRMGLQDKDLCL